MQGGALGVLWSSCSTLKEQRGMGLSQLCFLSVFHGRVRPWTSAGCVACLSFAASVLVLALVRVRAFVLVLVLVLVLAPVLVLALVLVLMLYWRI